MTEPTSPMTPPQARRDATDHREHGVVRPDPYAWLRDADDPAVLAHLVAERSFYDSSSTHLHSLVETLRTEMVSRVAPTERSPRSHRVGFSYYTEHPAGRDYARLLREKIGSEADPMTDSSDVTTVTDGNRAELMLDVNDLLGESGYLDLGVESVSPDERLLAYSVDRDGDEVFALYIRDLERGVDLTDLVPRTYYGCAWSADSRWVFYTVHDEAYRPFQVWRHRIGTPTAEDVLVLEEPDDRFEVVVRGTRSGDLVVLWSESNSTSECWVVDAHDVTRGPWSVGGRRPGVRYHAEHRRTPDGVSDLLIVTNDDAVEFRLMTAPVPDGADQDWTVWVEAVPEHPHDRLERVDAFAPGVLLTYRHQGTARLLLVPHDDLRGSRGVSMADNDDEPGTTVSVENAPLYDRAHVSLRFEGWLRPARVRVWDLADDSYRGEEWRQEAPGHDPARYVTEQRTFPSADGTQVPATIMRHRDTPLDGTAPALVYGYGSYEAVDEPAWDPALPSLLDRGVVYVYAHIRGGGELGRGWYLDGKLDKKQHTFDDHIAVADGLARERLVDPDRIATRGLSAGGLLQGAVFSQRPDRWRAVVAEVPFVDVVTTMFDEATPLTATEWEEWGDPRIREQFDWLLAYSPYDNLPPAGGRPDLLVTGAVHDPRVMVREPAKWVAALRHSDPEWSPRCLFRVETGAGAHVGPSGRFGHLAYEAEIYAWVLDRLGVADVAPR